MKKLTLIFTLLCSTVMFSSNSFAEWEKLKKNSVDGDTFYVDFERIRKHDGYVYYWVLEDLIKPDKDGDLSYRNYFQGDCMFIFGNCTISWNHSQMGLCLVQCINKVIVSYFGRNFWVVHITKERWVKELVGLVIPKTQNGNSLLLTLLWKTF